MEQVIICNKCHYEKPLAAFYRSHRKKEVRVCVRWLKGKAAKAMQIVLAGTKQVDDSHQARAYFMAWTAF